MRAASIASTIARALLVAAVVSCGGGGGGDAGPTAPPTQTPTPTPTASVARVEVTPAAPTLIIAQSMTMSAVTRDASGATLTGRAVTWTTSNAAIAAVSQAGAVTAVAAGTASIVAASEGRSGSAALTVVAVPVSAVRVTPPSAGLAIGGTVQLTAVPTDASDAPLGGRVVTWSSSTPGVATVSAGLVTAVSAGTATITASSEGKSGSAAIAVTAVPVGFVTVTPPSASVLVGSTVQLSAATLDAARNPLNGRAVTWGSSSTAIATVSATGVVTGVNAGTAVITATSEGKSASSTVTVTAPAPAIFTTPDTYFIDLNQTLNVGGYVTQDFTVGGTTKLVLRVAADYGVDAVVMTPGQKANFQAGGAFSYIDGFTNQFGTKTITLSAGTYTVGVRNRVQSANAIRLELDKDIVLAPEGGHTFRYVDAYLNDVGYVQPNGGYLIQPFTIQSGYRYLIDGANSGLEVYVIPASEVANVRASRTFQYIVKYSSGGSVDTALPGLAEYNLSPGDYALVLRNPSSIARAYVYLMERWAIQ